MPEPVTTILTTASLGKLTKIVIVVLGGISVAMGWVAVGEKLAGKANGEEVLAVERLLSDRMELARQGLQDQSSHTSELVLKIDNRLTEYRIDTNERMARQDVYLEKIQEDVGEIRSGIRDLNK
tara:strand:+ start:5906 stop:6277 length:372 start_codon:yes stop_codon:yes gene_type:complete